MFFLHQKLNQLSSQMTSIYIWFFSPEDLDNPDIFDKKRQLGENDSFICSLIRNDSVKEETPLFLAVYDQCIEIVKALLSRDDININAFSIINQK